MLQTLHRLQKMAIDHSPTILSALAVTGTVATAYLTGRASFRSAQRISSYAEGLEVMRREPTPRDKIELCWKLYIPAAAVGTSTVALIICANRVGTRRAAAMAAAFSLSERAFEEYREKIVHRLGEVRERQARDEIVQDHIRKDPPSSELVLTPNKVLCRDDYSGRYFESSKESLHYAAIEINRDILTEGYASLTEFYNLIGLDRTSVSDDVGWTLDKMLELDFSSALAPDGQPCLVMLFRINPIREYQKFH